MGIITLPNFRTTADVTAMVRLKDGGLAIDWSEAAGIKAWLYSDAQKAISGRFDVSVNQEDHTLLKCDYSATKPQYLGVNRIIVQATFRGRTKTYDKAAFNFVPRTSDVPGDITIEDPVVDLEIEVSDVSSSILDEVIYAAIAATKKANEAAEQIPLQVLTEAREATAEALDAAEHATPYIGENGHWWRWSKEAGEYVDTGEVAQGPTGNGIQSVEQTTESQESEGENVVTVIMTDGTQAQFTIRNGKQGERGLQGIPGASNAKYKQVDMLPEASAATMEFIYLTPSQTDSVYDMSYTEEDGGAFSWKHLGTTAIRLSDYTTKDEFSQLQQKVGDFSAYDEEVFNDIEFSPISGYVWDFAHDAPYETASGSYALVPVSAGEKYKLSGVSFSNAMPGAILYGNNRTSAVRLITGSSPFVFDGQEVTIPEGYDEMIVNGNTSNPIAIKLGTFVPGSAETAIKSVEKKADEKIADISRSGSYLVGQTIENVKNYVPFPEFVSKNLLNVNDQDVMLGYRQYNDTPEQNSSYNLSGYIPVVFGTSYVYSTSEKTYNDIAYLSVFDDRRGFIRSISGVTTFTPLAGESFVRITIRTAAWSKEAQFEEGTIPTEYSQFGVGFKYPEMRTPTISMPSKVYVYKGRQNSIYHKNYLDWITDDFAISSYRSYAQATWKFLERCFRATNPNQTIEILLHRVETRKELKQVSVQTVVGDPETDNGNVKVLCIGDSFTYDGRYIKQVSDLCPNITTVGMRTPGQSVASGLKCEGRGGWTLADYSVPFVSTFDSFSPFVQANGYNYYGVTTFWAAVKGTSPDTYRTNGFDASLFNASGYKLNPSVNDLMYDGSNFVAWNGNSWSAVQGELEFNFDFAKYLSIWGISTPDIVLIFLGKNDFHNGTTGWPTFKSRMDALIESIHSVNASIIVGVCTPTTADEAPNNTDNTNARLAHFNMWDARKLLIENYDGLENDNVFLVDTGTTLDPDYGFVMEEQLPFEYYEGDERVLVSTNGVHPSGAGYKQIGTCMAGFIQAKR